MLSRAIDGAYDILCKFAELVLSAKFSSPAAGKEQMFARREVDYSIKFAALPRKIVMENRGRF